MASKYITIEEFSKISKVSVKTIKRKADSIPGIEMINGQYKVLKGTRYPFPIGRYRIKEYGEKRYILFKSISQCMYIDYIHLNIYEEQFEDLISELLNLGFIKKNRLPNHFGANNYDTTSKGDDWLKALKTNRTRQAALLFSECLGTGFDAAFLRVSPT